MNSGHGLKRTARLPKAVTPSSTGAAAPTRMAERSTRPSHGQEIVNKMGAESRGRISFLISSGGTDGSVAHCGCHPGPDPGSMLTLRIARTLMLIIGTCCSGPSGIGFSAVWRWESICRRFNRLASWHQNHLFRLEDNGRNGLPTKKKRVIIHSKVNVFCYLGVLRPP